MDTEVNSSAILPENINIPDLPPTSDACLDKKAAKRLRKQLAEQHRLAKVGARLDRLRSDVKTKISVYSESVWNQEELDFQIDKVIKEGASLDFAVFQLFRNLIQHLNLSDCLRAPNELNTPDAFLCGTLNTRFGSGNISIPVPVVTIWTLLLSADRDSIKELFDELVPSYEAGIAKLLMDVPEWLPKERVLAWALRHYLSDSKPTPCIQYILDNMSQPKLQSAGFTFRGKNKLELDVKVPFTVLDKGEVLITISLCKNDICSFLGHLSSAGSFADAVGQVKEKAVDHYRCLVDETAEFAVECMPKSSYDGLIEHGQFVEIAKSYIVGVLRSNPKAFTDVTSIVSMVKPAMLTKCEEVESYNIAEQCRRALPARLADFYPVARSLKRKIVLVSGPTNSAKTYKALERFIHTKSGTYLAPLRLLALEVRDTLVEKGLPVSLITGELIELSDGASHCSSTIEMLDYDTPVDMAIIDETQMLSDSDRGSAWLQAVLGAPAKEVWLLGSKEAKTAVIALSEYLGEQLEIIETERLAPLEVSKTAIPIDEIPPQGALIAFSRQDVLSLAGELREKYNRKPAVIYGALSPEVRREQARMFRDGEADCVVATDAISMGLNLPISTIIFSTNLKYNGQQNEEIPNWLIHQIAGRAGRYLKHETGIVSAIDKHTLGSIESALSHLPPDIPTRFTFGPSFPVVKVLSEYLNTDHLATILEFFTDKFALPDSNWFTPGVDDDRKIVASVLDRMRLTLQERHSFLGAPVPIYRGTPDLCLREFAQAIEAKKPLYMDTLKRYYCGSASYDHMIAENAVKVLTLYCWLYYRYPDQFPDRLVAMAEIKKLNVVIARYLTKSKPRCCPECGGKISWNHRFRICDPCFRGQRRYRGVV